MTDQERIEKENLKQLVEIAQRETLQQIIDIKNRKPKRACKYCKQKECLYEIEPGSLKGWRCRKCKRIESVIKGTAFEGTHCKVYDVVSMLEEMGEDWINYDIYDFVDIKPSKKERARGKTTIKVKRTVRVRKHDLPKMSTKRIGSYLGISQAAAYHLIDRITKWLPRSFDNEILFGPADKAWAWKVFFKSENYWMMYVRKKNKKKQQKLWHLIFTEDDEYGQVRPFNHILEILVTKKAPKNVDDWDDDDDWEYR